MLHGMPALRAALIAVVAFFVLVLAFAFIRSGNVSSQQAMGQEDTGQEVPEDTTAPDPLDPGFESELPPLEPLPQRGTPCRTSTRPASPASR